MRRAVSHWRRLPEVLRAASETSQWLALLLDYLHLRRLSFPYEFTTGSGDRLLLQTHHDLITVWIIFFRHEYVVEESDRTILDLGANIGAFSLFASREAPRAQIYAFEPFPRTLEQLRGNLARNGLESRVTLYACAVTGAGGSRHMDLQSGPDQSRGLLEPGSDRGLPVQTTTLSQILVENALTDVDLMKIDVEGSEHEVLCSTSSDMLRRIRRIAMEYHPKQPREPLFSHLRRAGFALTSDVPSGTDSGVASFERI